MFNPITVEIVFFSLANLVVILSSMLITKPFGSKSVSERVLQVFLTAISLIMVTELFLGVVIQSLTWRNLLLIHGMVGAIAMGCFWKRFSHPRHFDVFSCLHCFRSIIKGSLFIKSLLVLAAIEVLINLFIGIFFPPGVWDCWTYHLTSVAYWMQDQAIRIIDTPVIRSNIFPLNSELLNLWNVIFLKSDRIVSLTQMPFAFMGTMAVYALSRKMGVNEPNSFVASLLFFFTPLVVLQSSTAQNDLMFAGILLAGIYFAQSFTESLCMKDLLFSGIASGILVGTKGHGVLFCFLLLGYILVGTMKKGKWSFLARIMLLYLIPVIGLGGFLYLRNWIHFHNPLYPATIEFLGLKIFSGNPALSGLDQFKPGLSTLLENLGVLGKDWFEIHDRFGFPEASGYGPQWIILGVPSILYTLIYGLTQRGRGETKCIIKVLFFILFSFVAFLYLRRLTQWSMRLTLFLPAGGALATGFLFQHASYLSRALIKFIVTGSILYVMINTTVLNLYAPFPKFELILNLSPSERTIANLGPWPEKLAAYKMIDRLAQSGDTIGYITHGDGWIYPLFGRHFERKVYHLGNRSEANVIALIRNRNIKYLILRRNVNLKVQRMIRESPQLFLLRYEGDNNVYEVVGQVSDNSGHAHGLRND
jgi:hypothetical protein